jgi:hypothetical protein
MPSDAYIRHRWRFVVSVARTPAPSEHGVVIEPLEFLRITASMAGQAPKRILFQRNCFINFCDEKYEQVITLGELDHPRRRGLASTTSPEKAAKFHEPPAWMAGWMSSLSSNVRDGH